MPLSKILAVIALVLLGAPAAAASAPVYQTPQAYYLALGDSMAYGFQPTKAGLPPSRFDTGYVDVFAAKLRALAPKLRIVNYGCPGETTRTFVEGGCSGRGDVKGLHDAFDGSQLQAALAFLRAHRGQVGPITLTLWGGDLFDEFAPACKGELRCIRSRSAAGLARFRTRLGSIVHRLRATAPKAEIILTGAWNFDVEDLRASDPLFRSIDAVIGRVATAERARVARMYPVFDPVGREKARICALTFVCSKGDPHPNDAGYRAMARAFLVASGYPR